MSILLGAIADDFTGATDLANTLVKQGMRVIQVIGVPDIDKDRKISPLTAEQVLGLKRKLPNPI